MQVFVISPPISSTLPCHASNGWRGHGPSRVAERRRRGTYLRRAAVSMRVRHAHQELFQSPDGRAGLEIDDEHRRKLEQVWRADMKAAEDALVKAIIDRCSRKGAEKT
mmetsp:Transcript_16457/g.52821  ORF Transcript_16457/g.52821 Transcript_16457/m.52821 type:complete len:108 (-) Transcript_16457:198-521(-)